MYYVYYILFSQKLMVDNGKEVAIGIKLVQHYGPN